MGAEGVTAKIVPLTAHQRPWSDIWQRMMLLFFGISLPIVLSGCETVDATRAGFVGTWELHSVEMHAADGRVTAVWGDDPVGRLVYDDQGRMFALLMPKARNQAAGQMIPEELRREVAGYYGTYVLDTKKEGRHSPGLGIAPRC